MESAIGVMIYQMGIGSLAYLGFLFAVARTSCRAYKVSGDFSLLFLYVAVVVDFGQRAVLRAEEAFFPRPWRLASRLLLGGRQPGQLIEPANKRRGVRAGKYLLPRGADFAIPEAHNGVGAPPFGLVMVTLKEIAKAVGVSTATVSRVLNFDQTLSVTALKRQAIIETAEALNYATPRARNRANQQGLSKVALVHFLRPEQEFIDPYYVGLRLGIESRCHALKIETVKVYHTDSMPEPALLQSASGVIAIGHQCDEDIAWLKSHSRQRRVRRFQPADRRVRQRRERSRTRHAQAAASPWQMMGYRRIGLAGWTDEAATDPLDAETRCRTYIDWMTEWPTYSIRASAPPSAPSSATPSRPATSLAVRLDVAEEAPPDVIVTCNDNMAVGAYRAINKLGLHIPEDVSVASFNDISVAQFLNPPLSTIRLPSEEIGETAVELLLERMAGRELSKRISLASQIIWRGSTRRPPTT